MDSTPMKTVPDSIFAALATQQAYLDTLPVIRGEGVAALRRLVTVAQGSSGQCGYVAAFLLGLYNGSRFPVNLNDLRCLDLSLFRDCMAVLAMDFTPAVEVHTYIENGSEVFEKLARDWNLPQYQRVKANTNPKG